MPERRHPHQRPPQATGLTALLMLLAALAACQLGPPPDSPAETPATTATAGPSPAPPLVTGLPGPSPSPFAPEPTATTPAETPTPLPTPTATPPPRTRYTMDVDFDYAGHRLAVRQEILYRNLTGEALNELALVVDAARTPGVFSLISLAWGNGEPVEGFSLEAGALTVPLPEPLAPEDAVLLDLAYDLLLPPRPGALGYTFRQAVLIDWFPYLPPYRPGEGWVLNRPWPFGEYLAYEAADFHVRIRLTDETEGLILAGPVPGVQEGEALTYILEGARSFAWSASPLYALTEFEAEAGTVRVYSLPEHAGLGPPLAETAGRALDLYSELFGAYPRPLLSVVEADFSDGKEYDGLIFISRDYHSDYDGGPQNFLTLLTTHEIAHQWWFSLVGNDQAAEPWLDESLATYSELLFYERYFPELASWWWFFRINYFNPDGFINLPLYGYGSFRPYWFAVYMRGALYYRDLRALMGDEAFFAFLKAYTASATYGQATAGDYLSLLRQHTEQDLAPLLRAYFDPAALPPE